MMNEMKELNAKDLAVTVGGRFMTGPSKFTGSKSGHKVLTCGEKFSFADAEKYVGRTIFIEHKGELLRATLVSTKYMDLGQYSFYNITVNAKGLNLTLTDFSAVDALYLAV